jgi:hypothetical protein
MWGISRSNSIIRWQDYRVSASRLAESNFRYTQVEYTAEVEQVDEATYQPHDADYWRKLSIGPCRWGMAGLPSSRFRMAASGDLSLADPELGMRCELLMAQTLGR